MLDGLRQDITAGVRGLARSPGFASAALLTLALGIGAASSLFSVIQAVILTPLPYAQPERRVRLFTRWVSFDKTWLSDREIYDFREMATTLEAVAGWTTEQQNLTGDGEPLRIGVGYVTGNAFEVLGSRPALGRPFTPEEDRPNGSPVAILGDPLWRGRYGADPSIVGRSVLIDGVPVQVIGVMPAGFRLPTDFKDDAAEPTQLWRPLQIDPQALERGNHGYDAAAVLAPGATVDAATEELRAIARRLTERGEYPEAIRFSAFAVPIDEEIRGPLRPALWLLSGAVVFLLLIACANVASLLLVRGDARQREMAVRAAVGAAPGRLARLLLAESLVLALGGAALGLGLAWVGLRVLSAVDPASLPPLAPIRLDLSVVLFTLALGGATTLAFGLLPALRGRKVDLVVTLREGGPQATVGGARQRLRGGLVVAEVAMAAVLVIGAGLMIRSLAALARIDLGFDPDRVLTLRLAIPEGRYETPEKVVGFYRVLAERLRGLPGAQAAGVVRVLPLATSIGDFGLDVEGFEEGPGRNAKGDWQIASDGAFEAMKTRLLRGRFFTAADAPTTPTVAIVNETLARTYFKDPDAVLGGRIRVGSDPARPWATIVGIVADERHNGVTGVVKEKFYIPHSQWHVATGGLLIRNAFVVVRTAGDPMALAGAARDAVRGLDREVPISDLRPMTEVVAASIGTARLTGFLLSSFASIALLLASVGIYGVLAYLVARRTHEIGIRVALGARRGDVMGMVLRRGLLLAGAGAFAGVLLALGLTRLMLGVLYEVRPLDPWTFSAVPALLLFAAAAASAWPAFRATRVSPLIALRTE